jgi:hypothetical protein
MPRREFLRLSSVAAVGVAVVAFSEGSLFAASGNVDPLLGVGYTPDVPKNGFSVSMADATTVLSPDPTFISRGARVRVIGSASPLKTDGGFGVDAFFPLRGRDKGKLPRFSFWSATSGRPEGTTASGGISFHMPVLATTGIPLVVRRLRPMPNAASRAVPPMEPESTPLTLSLGNVEGPKLQRGVYAIALREQQSDSVPSWSRTMLLNQNGVYTLSGTSVSYVLLQVSYEDVPVPVAPPSPSSRH